MKSCNRCTCDVGTVEHAEINLLNTSASTLTLAEAFSIPRILSEPVEDESSIADAEPVGVATVPSSLVGSEMAAEAPQSEDVTESSMVGGITSSEETDRDEREEDVVRKVEQVRAAIVQEVGSNTEANKNVTSSGANVGVDGGTEDSSLGIALGDADGEDVELLVEDESSPEDAPVPCKTLLNIISSHPELTTLTSVIDTANMRFNLNDSNRDITFFAPTDEAFQTFQTLLGDDAKSVLQSKESMQWLITNHAVRPAKTVQQLVDAGTSKTLAVTQGAPGELELTQDALGNVLVSSNVGSATVVTGDIAACGGYLHIVDAVLPPVNVGNLAATL